MIYNPHNPIIVQGDKSVLLEVDNPLYQDARDALARFAELEKRAIQAPDMLVI